MSVLAEPERLPPPQSLATANRRSVRGRFRLFGDILRLGASRGWNVLRPVVSIVSGMGWLVLVVAVASAAIGWILGWQEFVYLGITLFAGPVVAVAFIFGRTSYSVEIELNPRRVVAGDRALGRMLVTNSGTRRSTPSRLELPVGAGVAEFVLPALAPGEEHEELFAVPTNRRAVITAGPAVSVRGDQLGLLRRTVKWAEPIELFVHPVTTRLAPSAAGLMRDLEGEITKIITSNDISFHALRAYEPGDDRRNVHWRTSARTGQLMVRQFEETRRSQLTLIHSTDKTLYASDDEFELAVSVMASLGTQVIRDGVRLSVVTEQRHLRTRSASALLDDSCRVTPVASRFSSVREFARISTSRLAPASIVMMVGGSNTSLGQFRSVETLFGLDTQTVGFRVELGADAKISYVSGLAVLTVGQLTDLPRLLRRVR
jgi:uncharacterized protein (DUF58 family)